MIISGYQGIGKSTISGRNGIIDLESSSFYYERMRPDNWHEYYVNVAEDLSRQGYTVFVSCHLAVRNRLLTSSEKVAVIYPAMTLKDDWLQRLEQRFHATGADKDFRAWKNAEARYDLNIADISHCGLPSLELSGMDYDLEAIIGKLQDA